MITKEQINEAYIFFQKAYNDYNRSKVTKTEKHVITRIANYLLSRKDLNMYLIEKDSAFCEFKKFGRIEGDFSSVLRLLRQ